MALNELVIKGNILDKIKCRACVAFIDLKRISVLSRFFSFSQVNEHLLYFSKAEIISKRIINKDPNGRFLINLMFSKF